MLWRKATDEPNDTGSSDADPVARVVAWHNRDPLACRITASQVSGIGVVALPFANQAAGKRPEALFDEDFIDGLKTSAIARLARRHGSLQRPGSDNWPQRDIPIDPMRANGNAEFRFLRTAAIESGNRRLRVLIGNGRRPRILGQRLRSPRRSIAALLIFSTLAIGGVLGVHQLPSLASADDVASAGSVSASAAGADAPPVQAAAVQAPVAASAAALPALPVLPPLPPLPTLPAEMLKTTLAQADPASRSVGPMKPVAATMSAASEPAAALDTSAAAGTGQTSPAAKDKDEEKDRAVAADKAIAAKPLTGTDVRVEATAKPTPGAAAPPAGRSSEPAVVYALASASTITRQASELRFDLMNFPTEPAPDRPHAEVMRMQGRWRVVIWPIASRDQAEALRQDLAALGIRTEMISF